MRPRAIVWFELLYISPLAIGCVQAAIGWRQLIALANLSSIFVIQVIPARLSVDSHLFPNRLTVDSVPP
jgi:hypothetical protein